MGSSTTLGLTGDTGSHAPLGRSLSDVLPLSSSSCARGPWQACQASSGGAKHLSTSEGGGPVRFTACRPYAARLSALFGTNCRSKSR